MFPSVMVGDIAGIVKFWAAEHLVLVFKPGVDVSKAGGHNDWTSIQACGIDGPLRAPLRFIDRLQSRANSRDTDTKDAITLAS